MREKCKNVFHITKISARYESQERLRNEEPFYLYFLFRTKEADKTHLITAALKLRSELILRRANFHYGTEVLSLLCLQQWHSWTVSSWTMRNVCLYKLALDGRPRFSAEFTRIVTTNIASSIQVSSLKNDGKISMESGHKSNRGFSQCLCQT